MSGSVPPSESLAPTWRAALFVQVLTCGILEAASCTDEFLDAGDMACPCPWLPMSRALFFRSLARLRCSFQPKAQERHAEQPLLLRGRYTPNSCPVT
jgi:hypothetical protein